MSSVTLHPFHRIGRCLGITLWAGRRRVELWICREGVKAHTHPGQDVQIVPVFGLAEFWRVPPMPACGWVEWQSLNITPQKWFRRFSVPADWRHWFVLRSRLLVFVNLTTGPSAADNFAA